MRWLAFVSLCALGVALGYVTASLFYEPLLSRRPWLERETDEVAVRRRQVPTPTELAARLDRRLDEIVAPRAELLRAHVAFLDALSREHEVDYRARFATFWASRQYETARRRREPRSS